MKYEEFYQDIYNNNISIDISQDNPTEVFAQVTSFPQRPELDINQDKPPWGFLLKCFPQRPELDIKQDKSPWGFFTQVTSFPQKPYI